MNAEFINAENLLKDFKGESYLHGFNVLGQVGQAARYFGNRAVLVADHFPGNEPFIEEINSSLKKQQVELLDIIPGATPNAPREDVARIGRVLSELTPGVVLSFGGGSTIDSAKAAGVLCTLGGEVDDYFGVGLVTKALRESGKELSVHIAIQTAAGSAAHMTRYANITNINTGQKKLIVDPAIVPFRPVFDYRVTFGAPSSLTADGALDGISHALEVLFSAVGKPEYEKVASVACAVIRLVVAYLPRVLANLHDEQGRYALGLATDLGGYAIMLGGTNGAHLTSFSLVDILSHGRACGLLNPYYSVFFAPKVTEPLRLVGKIYQDNGYIQSDLDALTGRELGMVVARGMIAFERAMGLPGTLAEVPGFRDDHIQRALSAAKDLQLKMKLENMPVPMTAEMVDEYMEPILQAAKTGDLGLIRNVAGWQKDDDA